MNLNLKFTFKKISYFLFLMLFISCNNNGSNSDLTSYNNIDSNISSNEKTQNDKSNELEEGTLPEEATKDSFYNDTDKEIDATSTNKKLKIKKYKDRIFVGLMNRGGGGSQNATLFIVKKEEEQKFKNAMTSGSGSFETWSFDSDKTKRDKNIEINTKNNKIEFLGADGANYTLDKTKLNEIISKLDIN